MLKKSRVKQIVFYVALILLGMLISTSVLSSRATVQSAPVAEARDSNADAGAANQPAAPASPDAVWATCTPTNVAAYTSRIHVKCAAAAPGGIWYFAASTANAAHAARLLSVLSTAHAAGRTLDILYEPSDTSGASIGCDPSDCRLMLAAAFLQ